MADAGLQRGPDGRVSSPCVSVCRIDPRTGWCEGCRRTVDEIAAWSALDDAGRIAVWRALRVRGPGSPRRGDT